MNRLSLFYLGSVLAGIILLASGCAPHRPETDPVLDRQAMELSSRARSFNQEIHSSKGIGWAELETASGLTRYRIAWAAVFPNKIRLTLMVLGRPVETIISAGEAVTFFSHTGSHATHTVTSTDPNMKPYINVPVKLSAVINILLGRLPLSPHDDAYFSPQTDSRSRVTLFHKDKGPVQRIEFDSAQKIKRIVRVNTRLEPVYEYDILAFESLSQKTIPSHIRVTDFKEKALTLSILRFIPNPEIKPSVFVLTEDG